MLTDEQIQQLADELHTSETSRVPVEHFSKRFPGMSIDDGYRISRAWVARQLGEGRRVIGHKIGLTSRAMQISSQIDEPDYGTLLDSMLFTATPGPCRGAFSTKASSTSTRGAMKRWAGISSTCPGVAVNSMLSSSVP